VIIAAASRHRGKVLLKVGGSRKKQQAKLRQRRRLRNLGNSENQLKLHGKHVLLKNETLQKN
jgi:hypothetical protein